MTDSDSDKSVWSKMRKAQFLSQAMKDKRNDYTAKLQNIFL